MQALLRSGGLGASSLGEEGCEECFISSLCLVIRGQEDPQAPWDHKLTAACLLSAQGKEQASKQAI